jgi:hypothetical protein
MQYGELLKSEERVEDVSDGVTYVKVASDTPNCSYFSMTPTYLVLT